jgi:hypothetical protein
MHVRCVGPNVTLRGAETERVTISYDDLGISYHLAVYVCTHVHISRGEESQGSNWAMAESSLEQIPSPTGGGRRSGTFRCEGRRDVR